MMMAGAPQGGRSADAIVNGVVSMTLVTGPGVLHALLWRGASGANQFTITDNGARILPQVTPAGGAVGAFSPVDIQFQGPLVVNGLVAGAIVDVLAVWFPLSAQ